GFVPSKSLSAVALVLYSTNALINWIQIFLIGRRPFMLTLTIGMTTMAVGFAVRIIHAGTLHNLGIYILIRWCGLSPLTYSSTNYILLARLATTFDEQVTQRCLLVRHTRIVKFFVWSDAITFFLQASGGGLTATKNQKTADLGNTMIGLSVQLASFLFFTVVLIVFGWRPRPWLIFSRAPIDDWRMLFYVICATCVGIIMRSIFRIAEYAGGYSGYIAEHESFFYVFDVLPLWICMGLYIFVWPVRCLNRHSRQMELPLTPHLGENFGHNTD
ncbi:RTA1 like protein-domain-containing protein, partial [Mycena rebaudengoi]